MALDNASEKHEHTRMDETQDLQRKCKQCDTLFTPKAEHQKFCKMSCHDAYWRRIRRIARDLNERGLA